MIERLSEDIDLGKTRCVGYYPTFDEAHNTVVSNFCDIREDVYDYWVVASIKPGLYQYAFGDNRWFYKFDGETKTYKPITAPEQFDYLCGFAIA